MKKTDPLQLFLQHGVSFGRQNTTNSVGDCIFCGKDGHFCANPKTKAWDCKVCGKSGGFQAFLREVTELGLDQFSGTIAKKLAFNRKLKVSTLRRFNVGYNPSSDKYIIPVPYTDEQGGLWDVRHCRIGKRLMTTAGCQVGLLGWEQLEEAETIWLCEGEWDGMAMDEILFRLKLRGKHRIAAVPGANTFKADWFRFFHDKNVIVCYDNDQPGRLGATKVYNSISREVKSIKFVHWADENEEGFDIRDLYAQNGTDAAETMRVIKANLNDLPPEAEGAKINVSAPREAEKLEGDGLLAKTVYSRYKKWLHLPDTSIIDVVYGTIIANRQGGDPLWMFIVAEPGGTKTVPLISLSGSPNIITTTSLTPHALISGASFSGGGDPSLMAQLNNLPSPAVLVIKDFTTILNMPQQNREEIFGILRDAYDGSIEKLFGNGIQRRYNNCRFGILAGVTPAIEQHMEENVQLGERFISYRTPIPRTMKARRKYLEAARRNQGHEAEMAAELVDTSQKILNYDFGDTLPDVEPGIDDAVIGLAQFVSIMRGTVKRDKFSKEVTHRPFYELGTRLVKEFTKLTSGIAQFRRESVGQHELKIARAVARSSAPNGSLGYVRNAWKNPDKAYTSKELSEAVGLPDFPTGKRILEGLSMIGIFQKASTGRIGSNSEVYSLSDDMKEVIQEAGVFDG